MLEFRLSLEYACYPVWIIIDGMEEDDHPVFDEINSDPELAKLLRALQNDYEALFINDTHTFEYVGFRTKEEQARFIEQARHVICMVKARFGGRYAIVDHISGQLADGGRKLWL
ncbi:MAG: hypothetical protein VB111_09565 [Clostridiaceae bacterium]|nr:hypothetical protein [Clostridiaceae bacterium]